jgi:hypothetical protein
MLWLEEACRQRDQFMPLLKLGPDFNFLKDDPNFQDLVRRIGIPSS